MHQFGLPLGLLALELCFGGIILGLLCEVVATIRKSDFMHRLVFYLTDLFSPLSAQDAAKDEDYSEQHFSSNCNGNWGAPQIDEYLALMHGSFSDYRLCIHGLVQNPIELSLRDLRTLAMESYDCHQIYIQSWSGIAQLRGVPISTVLDLAKPLAGARCVFFHSFQRDRDGRTYYVSLDLEQSNNARAMLCFEMNQRSLSAEQGAPVRLTAQTGAGLKTCKWVKSILVVASMKDIVDDRNGFREVHEYHETEAEI